MIKKNTENIVLFNTLAFPWQQNIIKIDTEAPIELHYAWIKSSHLFKDWAGVCFIEDV